MGVEDLNAGLHDCVAISPSVGLHYKRKNIYKTSTNSHRLFTTILHKQLFSSNINKTLGKCLFVPYTPESHRLLQCEVERTKQFSKLVL